MSSLANGQAGDSPSYAAAAAAAASSAAAPSATASGSQPASAPAAQAQEHAIGEATIAAIESQFKSLQDEICDFLSRSGRQAYQESFYAFEKGSGGGRTRVFAAAPGGAALYEKGACNFSGIGGPAMPKSATSSLNIPADTPYRATGISLILHPCNPWMPTVHMNIRFFACGERWWFGGGMDVTPYYPRLNQVVQFHEIMQAVCTRHNMNYQELKEECDKYFFLPHRGETRGVGGLFFENLNNDFERNLAFTLDVGRTFIKAYSVFLENQYFPFSQKMRQFQLYRRGRYAEFNLIYDRGTKFGLSSGGRTESILVSLPPLATWSYEYNPAPNSWEEYLYKHFLRPRNWLHLSSEERRTMVPPAGYATGKGKKPLTVPAVAWWETETARLAGAAVGGAVAGALLVGGFLVRGRSSHSSSSSKQQ